MDGDGEDLLGAVLADDVLVEVFLDLARGRDVGEEVLGDAAAAAFLVEDRLAELDAFAANVDVARTLDERADVAVAFAAERAVGVLLGALLLVGGVCRRCHRACRRRHHHRHCRRPRCPYPLACCFISTAMDIPDADQERPPGRAVRIGCDQIEKKRSKTPAGDDWLSHRPW